MKALQRYWLGPIAAVRPWLVLKATLLLFGFDAFREHLRPAWRYGTAGFNVAHFTILDALPLPTTSLYVGVMVATGLAAIIASIVARPPRWLLAAIALAYLWSWSCSMHDSYQHHYLLSLFFLAFTCFPRLDARALFGVPGDLARTPEPPVAPPRATARKTPTSAAAGRRAVVTREPLLRMLDRALPHGLVPLASSWGMVIVWTTAAIVYAYTSVAKTEPEWISGGALRNITQNGRTVPGAIDLFAALGIEGDALWPFLGHSVIALQVACSFGYATAPLRDQATGRARFALEVVAIATLLLALSFHLGAEYMGLEIGWFSWYMILLALATFLPARWLGVLVVLTTWPVRAAAERATERGPEDPLATAILALCTALLLVPTGAFADLPGAVAGCAAVGLGLMALGVLAVLRRRPVPGLRTACFAGAFGGLALLAMLAVEPDVRYDYWRFAGGDFRRRGQWQLALQAYERANRYAPEGAGREDRIRELRARIAQDGPRRAPR